MVAGYFCLRNADTRERIHIVRTTKPLWGRSRNVGALQIGQVFRDNEDHVILSSIRACSVSGDIDGVEEYIDKFRDHAEHIREVPPFPSFADDRADGAEYRCADSCTTSA